MTLSGMLRQPEKFGFAHLLDKPSVWDRNMLSTWQEVFQILFLTGMLLITPGPTNTLLLLSGATSGFLNMQKLILAEAAGYFIAIGILGYMTSILASHLPGVVTVIKIFAAMYIFWLAVKMWRFQQKNIHGTVISAKDVFHTTLFNPKAFVVAAHIMPKTAFIDTAVYPRAMLIFFLALLPISAFWIVSGHFLYLTKKEQITKNPVFFRLVSLALSVFAFSLLYKLT